MNRMTLLIATGNTSCAQLSVSKNKLFISQIENYKIKKLDSMKLGLSKQKVSVVGTLNSHSFPLQKQNTS